MKATAPSSVASIGFLSRMVPRGLAVRVGVAVVIVGLFPIAVLLVGNTIETRWPRGVDQHFLLHVDSAAESVRQSMERGIAAVLAVAQDGVVRSHRAIDVDVESRLRQFNDLLPEYHHLILLDLDGQTLATSNNLHRGEWKGEQVFQRAKSGDVSISSVHLSLTSKNPVITFAAPVRDQREQVIGVLVGDMPVASIAGLVVRLRVHQEGHAFIVNSPGQVIAHPNPERLMETMDLPLPQTTLVATLVTGKESGRDYLYALAPVAADRLLDDWRVVLRTPTDEAYAYRTPVQWLVWSASISTAIVVLLVGTSLGLYVSRPVRRATAAARRMATGDLNARVESSHWPAYGGELGELSDSFNSMANELQARVNDLQESRRRIVAVQEGVRREIASHLHGRVQGRLLALRGQLQLLLERGPPMGTSQLLGDAIEDLDQVIQQEVSVLSRQLYPAILRFGLGSALRSLADQFEAVLVIEIELDEELVQLERANRSLVPEEVRLAAYRIAEEALTNVVKHSKATNVSLWLELSAEGVLRLTVEDNGQGFDVEGASAGLGTAAMRDHAEAVGGYCVIRSAINRGAEVTATLPLGGPGAEHPRRGSWRR